MNKLIGSIVLALAVSLTGGCTTTNGGHGLQVIEQMSDVDFQKWKKYIHYGVKISCNRSLKRGVVTEEELKLAATVIETLRDQNGIPGVDSFIEKALIDAGLNNDDINLILIIVEQELISRGALKWINPETQLVEWSPRTKEILTSITEALRSATIITNEEVEQGKQLEAHFNSKIL